MKKIMLITMLLISEQLFSITIIQYNPAVEISQQGSYTELKNQQENIFAPLPGAPAIPLLSCFIELDAGSTVTSIKASPQKEEIIKLTSPLLPIQQASAFSMPQKDFTAPADKYYQAKMYPQNCLYSWQVSNCGAQTILSLTLFAARYEPQAGLIYIPQSFELDIRTALGEFPRHLNTQVTEDVLAELGLAERQEREPGAYLAIAPLMFYNSLAPLLQWRQNQGYEVYFLSTGEISTNYQGEDLPARIRAAISDLQQTYGIEYVTLAGDHQHIPARYAFAFDCAYGAHDGENDLACDMYYSCLDGNWNADADTLYGEDEDETDLLPEVYVGRIPVNTAAELTSYIAKLLVYEKGQVADYNRAGGFSMDLWSGSQSELCQQYIYDNYFPADYDIEFIWGDENTEENAFALLSSGKNIVQHTGHGWINVMSLENYGHIYNSDIADLTNEWGGIVYSIGCWVNAFDYVSIGETFVREPQRNFLGFVGNSSYGWGAPSAAGFGFSEFYEKEFFRLLFAQTVKTNELGRVQALHKLKFIPYYAGTSIYKWVGYELNLCGDAAARLFTDNPDSLVIFASHNFDELFISVHNQAGQAIPGAVISQGQQTWQTGTDGSAVLPWNGSVEDSYNIYAQGYINGTLTIHEISQEPVLQICAATTNIEQAAEYELGLSVINPLEDEISFQLAAFCQQEIIDFSYDFAEIFTVLPESSFTLPPLIIQLIAGNQIENNTPVDIQIELQYIDMNFPTVASIRLNAVNASLQLTGLDWAASQFIAGAQLPVAFTFTNKVDIDNIEYIQFEFTGDNAGYLNFNPQIQIQNPQSLNQEEEIVVFSILEISPELPEDYFALSEIVLNIMWDINKTWQKTFSYYLGGGNLQIYEDFENGLSWEGDDAWQLTDTYAHSESYSLSCRPAEVGNYLLGTPVLTWAPGTELSFWYRCKMPMYGEDGFFLRLFTDESEELIIFLGSGGALPADSNRPLPEVYLETDWVYYQFDLQDIITNTPASGENFQLVFDFYYSEIIEDFSEYAVMEDIGIFIDDLNIQQGSFNTSEDENEVATSRFSVYPNPYIYNASRNGITLGFTNSRSCLVQAAIYDIRGRKHCQIFSDHRPAGAQQITWQPQSKLADGVYFVRLHTPNQTKICKILFLR